jgi:S1-C subfamily serine protease
MRAHFSRLTAIATVAVLASVSPLSAADTFDYRIVTAAENDDGPPRLLNLGSGDVLRSGARFRVEVQSHTTGNLDVLFVSSQGEEFMLVEELPVADGDRLSLPGEETWYRLDDVTGIERVRIGLSGGVRQESAEHVIRHVAPDLFNIAPTLEDPNSDVGTIVTADAQPAMRGRAPSEPFVGALTTVPDSIANYHGALTLLATASDTIVRGAKEAKLFRELSPGIVMIISDHGVGSGVIISDDGLILTNWHVVQGSDGLGIIFKPPMGQEVRPTDIFSGVVERIDPELDLALVKVINPPNDLIALELGEMRDIEVGLGVHAIGHPTGEGWTYTNGLISQVRPNYHWPSNMGFTHKAMVIQTQTPINPGSSGSPLISDDYKIVGINSFKKEGESLNFAVSVVDIRAFLSAPDAKPVTPVSLVPDAEQCSSPSRRRDTNGDGKVDRIMTDTDCDGKVDLVSIDEDHDGQLDFALADSDGDGKPELKMVSSANDGRFDLWLIDSDRDGRMDMVGYDEDYDGTIDRYTRG